MAYSTVKILSKQKLCYTYLGGLRLKREYFFFSVYLYRPFACSFVSCFVCLAHTQFTIVNSFPFAHQPVDFQRWSTYLYAKIYCWVAIWNENFLLSEARHGKTIKTLKTLDDDCYCWLFCVVVFFYNVSLEKKWRGKLQANVRCSPKNALKSRCIFYDPIWNERETIIREMKKACHWRRSER